MKILKDFLVGTNLITIQSGSTVFDTVQLMSFHHIGLVPVIGQNRELLGVFSERDLLKRVIAMDINPKEITVDSVMTPRVITCNIEESYASALEKMKNSKIRHIIVVENARLSGVVSMRALLELDNTEKSQTVEMLNKYMFSV